MPQSPVKDCLGNWHKLFEDFTTSTKEFYDEVEAGLERRKIPGLVLSRKDWSEGGVISPKREYLRITGGRLSFDVCAAPFGTGFFFSWWLVRRPARWVFAYFLGLLVAAFIVAKIAWPVVMGLLSQTLQRIGLGALGFYVGYAVVVMLSLAIPFWVVAILAHRGWDDPEEAIISMPILGLIYERFFAPTTYYKLDTAIMFRTAADAAVQETVDGLMKAKGLRALTEDERKPILKALL